MEAMSSGGGGREVSEVRADTDDLRRFVDAGAVHRATLRAVADHVIAARSRVWAVLGVDALPPARVARLDGGLDPLRELTAEVGLTNAFVAEIAAALESRSSHLSVDQRLALAGLDDLGGDLGQAADEELLVRLALRSELAGLVARNEVVDGGYGDRAAHEEARTSAFGVDLERWLDRLAGGDPARRALAAEVMVDYGLDLQANLATGVFGLPGGPDRIPEQTAEAAASTMLVTQGVIGWSGGRGDLVDALAGRSKRTADGSTVPALLALVDALDLDRTRLHLNAAYQGVGSPVEPWQRANQPWVREAALTMLVADAIAADGTISEGGQFLVDDVLDRHPDLPRRSERTPHDIVAGDRYLADVGGGDPGGDRDRPAEGLRITLARALAAPNYGLTATVYATAERLDDVDAGLAAGGGPGERGELLWLEREILVEELSGGDEAAATLLVGAMARGLSAADATRLVTFGADGRSTDARVRRLRAVYDTNAWGDPVPVDDLDPGRWPAEVATSIASTLAVELGGLQGIQLARFADGRPEAQAPLTDAQVGLVARYAELSDWLFPLLYRQFHYDTPQALGDIAAMTPQQRRDRLGPVPEGFDAWVEAMADPDNDGIWAYLIGAGGNDRFLGPNGEFRPAVDGTGRDRVAGLAEGVVQGGDPEALLVQLELHRQVAPYHGLIDGLGDDGVVGTPDGTLHEDELARWLNQAAAAPDIPPALVDRVRVGTSYGLGHDTFGWDELAEILGYAGLAATVAVTVAYSGGATIPLWVKGGLVGLGVAEAVAAGQAGDTGGAVLAGVGLVLDLGDAARLVGLAADPTDAMAALRAKDELIDLAARSEVDELVALADEAGDLTPAEVAARFDAALERNQTAILDRAVDEGATPAQVVAVIRQRDIHPVLAPGDLPHALHGEVKVTKTGRVRAVGGHYAASPDVRILERSEPDASGVTAGRIAVRDPRTGGWVDKDGSTHTFFPDHWSRRRTELEIDYAFKNSWPDPLLDGRWKGRASGGTEIVGFYRDATAPFEGWTTAYPLFNTRTGTGSAVPS